ncbi:putative terminal deoxycytidyl transferase rev1 [Schistosoma mansoni]|uniref:putative terminal deoxycytidyl transferase rev1 n=1 Tax=Schistosoma mansoni TaxID=6183 RepID=UPI0001A64670|nr:putative terminal deoxycytidyl transferase rev1 [Schistosoma mansoni]|eukprot:XP_018655495.1 putative terminal deoxycytidyl transferase rev1 [Schistosoma mansoni]
MSRGYPGNRKDDGWSGYGGYMRAKISKLEKQFSEQTESGSSLFSGVSIYVNGYTDPPALVLRDLIMRHGGRYQAYYSRSAVTHVIASRLPYGKINKLSDEKLVTATWITDSIEAGKLLPWQNYQLYPTHRSGTGQKTLKIIPVIPVDETNSNKLEVVSLPHVTNTNNDPNTNVNTEIASCSTHQSSSSSDKQARAHQMRVDECLLLNHMSKADTYDGLNTKVQKNSPLKPPITLKQLLNNKLVDDALQTTDPIKDKVPSSITSYTPIQQTSLKTSIDQKLATFYSRSRLHHLSSWAKDLHSLVEEMRKNPEHNCDLGMEWYSQISSDLSLSTNNKKIIELHARYVNCNNPNSYPLSKPQKPQIIFHIDMDCFFVSVSLRNRPELEDKPIAITHAKSSRGSVNDIRSSNKHAESMSEVASCSYTARHAGVKNGMLLGRAKQLCPDLIVLPYDFEAYKAVSELLYSTISRFTRDIQAVSCDELYADCTELLIYSNENEIKPKLHDSNWEATYQIINPLILGGYIRELVRDITGGCTASIGFGTSKLLARLATKKAKPNGQYWLLGRSGGACPKLDRQTKNESWRWYSSDENIEQLETHSECELTGDEYQWLCNLPLTEIPNIGRSLAGKIFQAFDAKTCGQLMSKVSHNQITSLLGKKTGNRVYMACRGKDLDSLQFEKEYKSVSASMNYGIRLSSRSELEALVQSLCEELSSRMRNIKMSSMNEGCVGKSLTIKLYLRLPNAPVQTSKYMGHGLCSITNHTIQMTEHTADATVLYRYAVKTVYRLCPEPEDLRGIGLQVHQLQQGGSRVNGMKIMNLCSNDQTFKDNDQSLRLPKTNNLVNSQCQRIRVTDNEDQRHQELNITDVNKDISNDCNRLGHLEDRHNTNRALEIQKNVTAMEDPSGLFTNKTLTELQQIFGDWITSEAVPQNEDVQILTDYLSSLVNTNLERIRSVLILLDRLITKLAHPPDGSWRKAYQSILDTLTESIKEKYSGFNLKLRLAE